jgi:hypothetical protein
MRPSVCDTYRGGTKTAMTLRSAFDPAFLEQVKEWIEASGEVFVVIRYAYAAGAKDYLFMTSYEQFQSRLGTLPSMADVIVFRQTQLPIRGVADGALLDRACADIPDGEWWFLVCPEEDAGYYWGDKSHETLKETFEEYRGKFVAIGLEPPYHEEDNPNMQSGLIPMPDGTIKAGVY